MTRTVQEPRKLEEALKDLAWTIHPPHFKTKQGQTFELERVQEAIRFRGQRGEKAILSLL